MIDGILYINGEVLPQQADGTFVETNAPQGPMRSMPRCANRPGPRASDCLAEQAIETLPGGQTHAVLDIEDGFGDTTPVFTVPAGEFFFMGDNRDNSMDSRFPRSAGGVGFVPFENLIGRADRVIFSSAGAVDARLLDLAARPLLQGDRVKLEPGHGGRRGPPRPRLRPARAADRGADPPLDWRPARRQPAARVPRRPRARPRHRRGAARRRPGSRPRATSPRASTRSSARRPAPRSRPRSTSAPACAWAAPRC